MGLRSGRVGGGGRERGQKEGINGRRCREGTTAAAVEVKGRLWFKVSERSEKHKLSGKSLLHEEPGQ